MACRRPGSRAHHGEKRAERAEPHGLQGLMAERNAADLGSLRPLYNDAVIALAKESTGLAVSPLICDRSQLLLCATTDPGQDVCLGYMTHVCIPQ